MSSSTGLTNLFSTTVDNRFFTTTIDEALSCQPLADADAMKEKFARLLEKCACAAPACQHPDDVDAVKKSLSAVLEHPQAGFWRHTWKLKGSSSSKYTLSGHSRSLERTGFVINELNIFLDAGVGWKVDTPNPEAILVTHGHIDHINALPMLLRCGPATPYVFVPRLHLNNVREMCRMTWSVKMPDASEASGVRRDVEIVPNLVLVGGQGCRGENNAEDGVGEASWKWFRKKSVPPVKEAGEDQSPDDGAGESRVIDDANLIPCVTKAVAKEPLDSMIQKNWVAAQPGLQYRLPANGGGGNKKGSKAGNTIVRTVHCYHKTGDVGYVLCEATQVQKGSTPEIDAELMGLRRLAKEDPKKHGKKCGQRIQELKKTGGLVNVEEVKPFLAYLLDTTVQVFGEGCEGCLKEMNDINSSSRSTSASCIFYAPASKARPLSGDIYEACLCRVPKSGSGGGPSNGVTLDLLHAQRELLFSCANIVIECTFLATGGMTEEDADREAVKRTHTSWGHLRKYVLGHPECTFVLVHFSRRYKDEQIKEYFVKEQMKWNYFTNVVLWLDSGIVDFAATAN
ncbi:unnamed protein product [Amoebophrya sp. A25]|nr:unnamed protein product [Amoebophrya sp. A25]|eukprot:GSA25T00006547001.1